MVLPANLVLNCVCPTHSLTPHLRTTVLAQGAEAGGHGEMDADT